MITTQERLAMRAKHETGQLWTEPGKKIMTEHQLIIGSLTSLERTLRGTLEGTEANQVTDYIRAHLAAVAAHAAELELAL